MKTGDGGPSLSTTPAESELSVRDVITLRPRADFSCARILVSDATVHDMAPPNKISYGAGFAVGVSCKYDSSR